MIELVEGRKHQIIKRDGRLEEYAPEKLYKAFLWACDGNEDMAKELLKDMDIKIFDKISISKMFDEAIETAANKISELLPIWDEVAKRLFIQKIYKEVWGIKRDEYPHYKEVLDKGTQYGIYNKDILDSFSEEEIEALNQMIVPERDFAFTFGGLNLFMQKYAKKYTKKKHLELPQHAMLRVAIQLHYTDKNRLETIKEKYDLISTFTIVIPTPIYLNALAPIFNPTSCVLTQADDDSESIAEAARSMAIYSKNGSGLGIDITRLRSLQSLIGKDGVSSGPIPFIQYYEKVVQAWNQKCYSDDTEILTENGWRYFKDLKEEKVAQYVYNGNGEGNIEFVEYTDFYEYKMENQPMYRFYTKTGKVDLLVSQNHRMVKLIKPSGKLSVEYAKDMNYGSGNYMITSGGNLNKNKPLDIWSRFLIAYQADGMRDKRLNGNISGYLKYRFSFSKKRKIKRFEELLDELIMSRPDISYIRRYSKNGEREKTTIFDVKIPLNEPILPKDFSWVDITRMSEQEIDEFFEELKHWDGGLNKSGTAFKYFTTDKKNIDVIHALASVGNYRVVVSEPKKQKDHWKHQYHASISKKNTFRSCAVGQKEKTGNGIHKEVIAYTGKIYCVTVPSGMLVVRRNNAVAISGNSARVGAAAVYYPWWAKDTPEIIMLKDAGGQDSERARALKYAIKWNKYFSMALALDMDVYLFDPKDVPELIEATDKDFIRIYKMYCEKADKRSIGVRKMRAKELAALYLKVYGETGNNYWMSMDNANKFKVAAGHINMSNLCTEILLTTKPVRMEKNGFYKNEETGEYVETREYSGEIGICNLTNINIVAWDNMSEEEKDRTAYSILLGMDNAIEVSAYPVKAGERFNKLHRALGIGLTNYHNWLALNKVRMTDDEALRLTHEITESIAFYLTKNSIELAKERGRYHYFEGSLWSKGKFQHELYEEHFNKVAKGLNFENKYNWDSLRGDMVRYGVRFENLMAVAPGATSSLALSFTEGCEPIRALKVNKEGTYTLPFLAPNLQQNRPYYETCWDIPMTRLIELAAIRQKFIDQSQSTNIYVKKMESSKELLNIILYAEKLGVKTLYYLNSMKAGDSEEVCESCSV